MTDLGYPPPFQDLATLAEHLSTGETTIENWVKLGQFPKPKKVGGKRLWSWKEVCRFMEGPQDPTTVSLLERITNATREAAGSKDRARNVRKRDQGVSIVPEIREPSSIDAD
jgi:predicted DNA-binding transcriptional regulator AlpA